MNSKSPRPIFAALGLMLVMASGMFPGPAQAAELPLDNPECGEKILQSFRLSADRTCPGSGTAWHIDKAGIIVDLNGFHLRGDRSEGSTGILFEEAITTHAADDVIIRNGTIRGFDSGITIGSSVKRTKINRVSLIDNVDQAIAVSGSKTTISNSTVVANDEDGIIVQGDSTGVQVLSNRIANNLRYGIFVISDGNTVSNNAVISNGKAGLLINGDENQISLNNVAENGNGAEPDWPGIYVLHGKNNAVTSNKIFGNGDDGYRNGDDADNNEVTNNTVRANGYFHGNDNGFGTGIDVGDSTGTTGSGNLSLGNDATLQCNKASMCKTVQGDPSLPVRIPPCGKTVLSSFRLGADMTCTGTALNVGASNITIDLAGHTLKGDGVGDDFGIFNSHREGVRLTNGVIRGFDSAIRLNALSEKNVVDRVIAVDSVKEGFSVTGTGHVLARNTAVANGIGGFSVFATSTTVEYSRSANNATSGIFIGGSDAAKVRFNVVAGNTGTGISLANGAGQSKVRHNVVGGNGIAGGYGGIESSVPEMIVEFNTVFGNGGAGYKDTGLASPTVNLNRFDGNGYVNGVANDVGLGIDANLPFHVGVDNIAYGNDDDDECDPASMCE